MDWLIGKMCYWMDWWPFLSVLLVFVEAGVLPGFSVFYYLILFVLIFVFCGGYIWFHIKAICYLCDLPILLKKMTVGQFVRIPFHIFLGALIYENEKLRDWFLASEFPFDQPIEWESYLNPSIAPWLRRTFASRI